MAAQGVTRGVVGKAPLVQGNPHRGRRAGAPERDDRVLDHPVWTTLSGPHSALSRRRVAAARYPASMSPFAALAPGADVGAWDDLATLIGPDGTAVLVGEDSPPEGWAVVGAVRGVQMVDVSLDVSGPVVEAQLLGPDDVPEMLALVGQTRPGPFGSRTIELGTYLGHRQDEALVAMAGQRLHPPGWTEISAVCTRPDHRGRGLASGLVRLLGAEIRSRGETPFLHASATNVAAIRLYESIGFVVRREITFAAVRTTKAAAP